MLSVGDIDEVTMHVALDHVAANKMAEIESNKLLLGDEFVVVVDSAAGLLLQLFGDAIQE